MSEIKADDYWASKTAEYGDVDLFMSRKRQVSGSPRGVLFLVHGSSFSGPTGFDLQVPGREDYSLMDRFAASGFDVWTLDHEGYGRSSRTKGWSDIASGVEDLKAGFEIVTRETGATSAMFYGSSSGALRAAAFAQACPAAVTRLVLDAFVWTGKDAPTLIKRAQNLDYFRAHNTRVVDHAFFESIFTRDKPGTSEPEVAVALAETELQYGNTVPTGTYLDMCANLPVVDPEKIACPVMIVRGEHDGVATLKDLLAFFEKLPNMDKQFAIFAGQAHVTPLGLNRARFWHAMEAFLTMPERIDV
ncbi:MAG: alpha/beta fold hydrolase [Rhodospirillaceae bacterium]